MSLIKSWLSPFLQKVRLPIGLVANVSNVSRCQCVHPKFLIWRENLSTPLLRLSAPPFFISAPPEQTARSDSFIIASFYRPPSAITSLSDLLLNPTSLFPPLFQTCCQNATYPLDRVPNCHECQKWVGEPDYLPTRQGPQPTPRDPDYRPTRDRVPA